MNRWSTLLRPFVKRRGDNLRFHSLSPNLDSKRTANCSVVRRYVRQTDIFLQVRGVRAAGDVSDFRTAVVQHFVAVPSNSAVDYLQPNQRPLQSIGASAFEGAAADKFRLFHFAEAVKLGFPNIDTIGNFVPVERELGLKAKGVASAEATGDSTEFFARG